MNAKKAIRKVVALGVGVSMLGATLLGATAADLGAYPAPYIKDGMFNGLMVVGDDAAPADIIGVTDIAMSLQYSSTVKETIKVSSEAGVSLGGDSVKIQRSGDVLELNELFGEVMETLDSGDAEALKSFTVSNDKGTTDVNQYLRFAWDTPSPTDAQVKVLYTEDEDDNVGDFMWFDDGEAAWKYELEFVEGFESDRNDADNTLDDLEDETLHILGEDFAVVQAKLSDSGRLSLDLMGGAIHDTIEEGETKTYTLKGKEYEVTALIISDWAGATGGNAKVKLKVNGEVTKQMTEGSTEILNDGTTIGIREVLPNEAGETAGGDILEFYLGAFKIKFEDGTGDSTSFDGTVEVNEENIEDSDLSMVFTNTSDYVRISKISYILYTDGVGGDEVYASPGQGLREKLDEPEGMLADAWDIRYEGLSDPGNSEIRIKPSGDDEYRLSFTSTQGIDYSNIRLFYVNNTDEVYYGDEKNKLVVTQSLISSDGDYYTIHKKDYFVLGHNTNLDTGVTRILRLDSLDTTNELVQLTDVGTGATLSSQYTPSCDLNSAGACTGDINVGGYTFSFAVMNTTGNEPMLLVDLNDSNADLDGASKVQANIVTKGGGILTLEEDDLMSYRGPFDGSVGTVVTLTTLKKNFDENENDEEILINVTADADELDLDISGDVSLFNPEDNDDVKVGMSKYGVMVKVTDSTSDPDSLTVTYPLSQVLPQAFVTFEKTVTMEGGAGTITVERPQRIEIGSAVLASQVSDPTAANVITVGGPCINSVTAEIMGLTYPACGADSGLSEGQGVVKLFESGEKVAIVVAGWEAEDTTRATRVLADYKTYQQSAKLVGTEVKVTGTSATEFTVTPVSSTTVSETTE